MNILDLAQLPIQTLLIAVLIWLFAKIYQIADSLVSSRKKRNAIVDRIRYLVAFNYGVLHRAYHGINAEILALESKQNDSKTDKQASLETSGLESIFNWLGIGRKKSTKTDFEPGYDIEADFGYLDLKQISNEFHLFKEQEAGLVLFFIEELPLIKALYDKRNALNDKATDREKLHESLGALRVSIAEALLAGKGILDETFREKLSPKADIAALVDEITNIADIGTYNISDGHSYKGNSFEVLKQRKNRYAWLPYLLPAGYGLIIIGALAFAPIRQFLLIENNQSGVSCETKISATGEKTTQCSYTLDALPAELNIGLD